VSAWETVIGLEVHAQLLTDSKIFCGCSTRFGAPPNTQVCEVCAGMPGVLPVLNARVVEFAVRCGLALGCEVRARSVFARKNYFYPDLPKGFQISQYELPICEKGSLELASGKRIGIVRAHIEEDAGKNIHVEGGDRSLVDFNRCGVPLIEIVGEPEIRSSDEAVDYLKSLRAVVMYLGINDGNMEEGSLRCDANVSVRRPGAPFGTRVEIKNMNSFRFVKQALEFEAHRQIELLESGGKVSQETRLFDHAKGETRAMRSKEFAHDYRYFPEPDLMPIAVDDAFVAKVRSSLPELPRARAARYVRELGLSSADAENLVAERGFAELFEAVARAGVDAKKAANWCLGPVARGLNEGKPLAAYPAARVADVIRAVDAGQISSTAAREHFDVLVSGSEALPRQSEATLGQKFTVAEIIREKGLAQVSDESTVEAAADAVIAASPGEVEKYRAGKKALIGFFVGQVMKRMGGKGNPAVVNAVLKRKLGD
jgi:aspartyl-tRNA(Asn)/glutamyl-tRNA(Gln) amidotransferase subunit B